MAASISNEKGRKGRRALVVGGDSLIGSHCAAALRASGWRVNATTRRRDGSGRPQLDLAASSDAIARSLNALSPVDAVVVAAARARVGDCEIDPDGSRRVNVTGALAVAEAARAQSAYLLLLSSDKVFDGRAPRRCRGDPVSPQTRYGQQKAEAEAAILALGGSGVLRLSKVLAPELALFAEWAASLRAGRPIMPFQDMYLAPVHVAQVAALAETLLSEKAAGIWQFSGTEDVSYASFAYRFAERMRAPPTLVRPKVCDAKRVPPAARPPHSTLDMSEEWDRFGIRPPETAAVLDRLCDEIAEVGDGQRLRGAD